MSKPKVLVADDEENVRLDLRLRLAREGFEVVTVETAHDALEVLKSDSPDVVLCDLLMPGLDGLGFLTQQRALGPPAARIPTILMSAHADVETALKAVELGAVDYLPKPARTDEVVFRLRRALELSRLRTEVADLRSQLDDGAGGFGGIVAGSDAMQRVFGTIRKVAHFKTTVLIQGESGTGKELVARALHDQSGRRTKPFVAVNCGAIPEQLLETELFGHVRGAFSDATRDRRGLFEEADGGTFFLDEIGELPLPLQVKLLRVLQEEEVRRVGESRSHKVDVRVVAATVRDLAAEVRAGRFREDLFYRLNVLTLRLPPLRERADDIPLLIEHFVRVLNRKLGTRVDGVTPAAGRLLARYAWPGNVRELENTIERALVLADGALVDVDDLPPKLRQADDPVRRAVDESELSVKRATRQIEEALIRKALDATGGNRTRAAELLELSPRALLYKIKEFGLR
jgi:two-component system response regulator AtoC